jgi:hypothetical protein
MPDPTTDTIEITDGAREKLLGFIESEKARYVRIDVGRG